MSTIHETELAALDELTAHPRNYRSHPEGQLDHIKASIKEHGFYRNVVTAQDGTVLAGHGVVEACRELGVDSIPIIRLDIEPDSVQALKVMAGDNAISDLAIDDGDALAELLGEIALADDLDGTGFDDKALAKLLKDASEGPAKMVEENVLAEVPKRARAGDVWALGEHRLVVGSCTVHDTVDELLRGVLVNVAVTSPPYSVQREYDKASGFQGIPADEYVEWFRDVADIVAEHLTDDGSFFVNIKPASNGLATDTYVLELVLAMAQGWGWNFATEFCHEKNGMPGRVARRFKNQFEPVYQFTRPGFEWKFRPDAVMIDSVHKIGGGPKGVNVVAAQGEGLRGIGADCYESGLVHPGNRIPRLNETHDALGHPAAFPVGLPAFFINAYSDVGDVIYDPFMGSGSTIMAAEQTGRRAYGCELSPKYVDITLARWENLTGGKAERLNSTPHTIDDGGLLL